jgi:formate dehydrogenase maturation protein FdhE
VIRGHRGGPGKIDARLGRAERLLAEGSVAAAPLALLAAVLRHHQARSSDDVVRAAAARSASKVDGNLATDHFPLLELEHLAGVLADSMGVAVAALIAHGSDMVPEPLADAGREVQGWSAAEAQELAEVWLDDPSLVEPRLRFWAHVAGAPFLEAAAVGARLPPPDAWRGGACPLCGGQAQVSVIAEESGEFMGGSPRSLVCARCATWWNFPRAVCALCGEEDPRHLASYVAEGRRVVRVDACETCRGYVKTFDLREEGAAPIVPLVDDVATLTMDLWASEQGFERAVVSIAGV